MHSLITLGAIILAVVNSAHLAQARPALIPAAVGLGGYEAGKSGVNILRRNPVARRRDTSAMPSQSSLTDTIHGIPPTVVVNKDKSVIPTGVSATCISEIKTYNNQPYIDVLNAV